MGPNFVCELKKRLQVALVALGAVAWTQKPTEMQILIKIQTKPLKNTEG